MAFVLDNMLFIINTLLMNLPLKKKKTRKIIAEGDAIDLYNNASITVMIPVKRENGIVIDQTIRSLVRQTFKPACIYLLVDDKDKDTIQEINKMEHVEDVKLLILEDNGSKADALNRTIEYVTTTHVLIIDAGDYLIGDDYLEQALREIGTAEVCIPKKVIRNGHHFVREMMRYEFKMWDDTVQRIYQNYDFCPLPGTGIIIRSDFLRTNKFPDTLAEDAALGMQTKDVVFASSKLCYNIPDELTAHLKQRARWNAGYIQNLRYANTAFAKWLCITPLIQILVPISLLLMPITIYVEPYGMPWTIIDILAAVNLMSYLAYMVIKFRSPKLFILVPIWWFITGLSAFIALYYYRTGKWYLSPKSITETKKEFSGRALVLASY